MDINIVIKVFFMFSASILLAPLNAIFAATVEKSLRLRSISDGTPLKKVLAANHAGENLLDPSAWRPWQKGYEKQDDVFICNNASDSQVQRGVSQTIILNQTKPEPIVAVAWSKADAVDGSRDSNYSLYLEYSLFIMRR